LHRSKGAGEAADEWAPRFGASGNDAPPVRLLHSNASVGLVTIRPHQSPAVSASRPHKTVALAFRPAAVGKAGEIRYGCGYELSDARARHLAPRDGRHVRREPTAKCLADSEAIGL